MLPRNNDTKFDEMLKKSLKNHCEIIPDDFAETLLVKVEKLEQQRMIQKVIMQERLFWAAAIIFPLMMIGTMILFPSVIAVANDAILKAHHLVGQIMGFVINKWQITACYLFVALACIYAFYQMSAAEE